MSERTPSERVRSWSHVGAVEVQWSRPRAPWMFRVTDSNGKSALAMLRDEQVAELREHLARAEGGKPAGGVKKKRPWNRR